MGWKKRIGVVTDTCRRHEFDNSRPVRFGNDPAKGVCDGAARSGGYPAAREASRAGPMAFLTKVLQ